MAKLHYKQVVEFFDEVNTDMAELVLGIIEDNLSKKADKKMKMSANLKKARAARGTSGNVINPSNPPAQRGRPRSVHVDPNDNVGAQVAGG